jgi:hypothetical protein
LARRPQKPPGYNESFENLIKEVKEYLEAVNRKQI